MLNAEVLNAGLGHWLPLFVDVALKSLLVSAAALAALPALRRAPAATRHLALLAGLGVLLGLPALMALLPRQALPRPAPVVRAVVNTAPPPTLPAPMEEAPHVPTSAGPIAPAAALPLPAPLPPSPVPAPAPMPVRPAWLVAAWLLGVLACAGRMLAAQARAWRLTRRCPRLPLAAPESASFFALKNGPAGTPPMVWGWPRPTLLLPPESASWPAARLRAVLLHEAAHVRRQDWLTQTLTQAACALYWFNPLVWLLAARLQSEAERAADDAVLLAGVPPADYAQDLHAVARALSTNGRQRRASFAAVTMARRSQVRGRLEAILDARRPRRRLTRCSAALAFAAALAVAAPLAALRPAARADEAPAGQDAPTPGVPTEADLARVQRHLQSLQEARAEYGTAHPNTLTAAQIALVGRLLEASEDKRGQEEFDAFEATQNKQLRAEAKKPHTKEEREQIWGPIFSYEHTSPIVTKRRHIADLGFAQLKREVASLPTYQRRREGRIHAFDGQVALDKTQLEMMQMERAEGYPLHISQGDIATLARMGLQIEERSEGSRADWVLTDFLNSKLNQVKHLDDRDIDALTTLLREPSTTPNVAPMIAVSLFRKMRDKGMRAVPPSQQQQVREALTVFLTSHVKPPALDKLEHKFAGEVLHLYGGSAPTPPPAQKAQAAPAAPRQTTLQTAQTGVSSMTPRLTLKPLLLRMAAFTALAAGLTAPAAHAAPPAPKPTAPAPAAGGLHWDTIALQHTTLKAILGSLRRGKGVPAPDGVKHIVYMMGQNTVLVQATPAGLAHMRDLVAALDVAPRQVQLRVAVATVPAAALGASGLRLDVVPSDGLGAASRPLGMPTQAASGPAWASGWRRSPGRAPSPGCRTSPCPAAALPILTSPPRPA